MISPLAGEHLPALVREAVPPPDGPATWAKAKLVRYADDFVVLARYQSRRLIDWIEGTLEGRFRLTINREKTRMVKLNQPGASLTSWGSRSGTTATCIGRDRRYLNVFPSAKAMARAREQDPGADRPAAELRAHPRDDRTRSTVGWKGGGTTFATAIPVRSFAS